MQLLEIAGALILILVGIIGFFMQRWIKATDALTSAISELRVLIATMQGDVSSIQNHCHSRCAMVDEKFKLHAESIQSNTLEIELIKQTLKYEHQ
jgi:hypothetical protein